MSFNDCANKCASFPAFQPLIYTNPVNLTQDLVCKAHTRSGHAQQQPGRNTVHRVFSSLRMDVIDWEEFILGRKLKFRHWPQQHVHLKSINCHPTPSVFSFTKGTNSGLHLSSQCGDTHSPSLSIYLSVQLSLLISRPLLLSFSPTPEDRILPTWTFSSFCLQNKEAFLSLLSPRPYPLGILGN